MAAYAALDLQKAIDNIDFVKRKPTPAASSEPLTSDKNLMVGFDVVIVRLMAMLTGEPSGRRVIPIVGMGGIESVVFSQLESVLSYSLGTKKRSWPLVSRLMQSKKASDDENEFNMVDSLLQLNQENELVNHIKEMDSSIEVLEEDLESIFKQLIKTRVSLLNILNH